MIYKKFGNAFRQLREQKFLSLSDFTSIGISKASLSRFERAETMMSFEKVVQALQLMGVSLEEYENFLNDYSLDESSSLIKEIEIALFKGDRTQLQKIYTMSASSDYRQISLSAKASFTSLNCEEIDEITDFLYNIKIWSPIELFIFYFTMDDLNTNDILYLIDSFFIDENHIIFNSPKYKGLFVRICCRATCTLSYRGYRDSSEYIIKQVDIHKLVNSMFLRNLFHFSKGFWTYTFKSKNEGNTLMLRALDIFYLLSTPDIANYYQNRYDHYLKK